MTFCQQCPGLLDIGANLLHMSVVKIYEPALEDRKLA
jgi:hypothetical protein